jgi:hypothetical protein
MTGKPNTHTATIDQAKLKMFLFDYFNEALPGGSISTIMTTAFRALIAAGVVVIDGDTKPGKTLQIDVHGGRVALAESGEGDTWWTPQQKDVPLDFASVVEPIAEMLTAIINSPPWDGGVDWPYTRN